ncbi:MULTISPECIES: OmpP1/FadL family transporter [unclassified Pseudodesulfovibrio]|uniref:OmpP1/FadL family transporter n=1 Tax=unclassified Pseudodesulfovibrio TaxID=2661612 RepID=UPI000FEBA506|nr:MULTISPECIES: OmpP1/FadL family transporter [unclassified Pseudodesulfovibrio]MCJ2164949.1 OmpP1/FadL family transporter [Pseudodesulfovibrio sp. S3-i]RWU03606.1 transporter [Pseudodesulfovibrio sp. S3]
MKRVSIVFFFCFLACLLTTASVVQAGGFALYEWGNRALGMGTANYATGNDASVVAYNPALMTKLEGTNVYGGVTAISPSSDVYIDGNKNQTASQVFGVPHGFITHQVSDDWTLGFGMFTRFGLGTKYDEHWDGATLLKEAELETFSFNPSAAYKVTDDLSVAGGIEVIKGNFLIRKQFNAAFPDSTFKVDVADTAIGFNMGLLYDLSDQLSLGLTYRSPVHFEGKGSASVSDAGAFNQSGDVTMTADFPASYNVALGYTPFENLTIEFDVLYTQWEQFDRIEFDFSNMAAPVVDTAEDFNYKSTWRFQLGLEYLMSEMLALRAGYVYDQTPTRGEYASVMLPANDRQMFTVGAGYKWDNLLVDVSGMYIVTKERHGMTMTNSAGTSYDVDFEGGKTWAIGSSIGYTF